jgi:hypothetical protein
VSNRFGWWINGAFDRADGLLARLQRHCPRCGGGLERQFSLLDKIGLHLPLPHTIHARHECEQCHARFVSYRPLTDFYLEASWTAAVFLMGELWPIALACPLTWLIASRWCRSRGLGNQDTILAGCVTAILWILVLVFGDLERGRRLLEHAIVMMPLIILALFVSLGMVLVLDRYTTLGSHETSPGNSIEVLERKLRGPPQAG